MIERMNVAFAAGSKTNTPRWPVLPPCRKSHVPAEDRDGLGAGGGQRLLDRGEG
jgi:hypothetical protein